MDLIEDGFQVDAVANVCLSPYLQVDRDEIGPAIALDRVPAKEQDCDRARLYAGIKLIELLSHSIARQVFPGDNSEFCSSQSLGHQ